MTAVANDAALPGKVPGFKTGTVANVFNAVINSCNIETNSRPFTNGCLSPLPKFTLSEFRLI